MNLAFLMDFGYYTNAPVQNRRPDFWPQPQPPRSTLPPDFDDAQGLFL